MGRWQESAQAGAQAVALDPLNAVTADQTGLTYAFLRNYQQAEQLFQQAIRDSDEGMLRALFGVEPDEADPARWIVKAWIRLRLTQGESARAAYDSALVRLRANKARLTSSASDEWRAVFTDALLGIALSGAGQRDEALPVLARASDGAARARDRFNGDVEARVRIAEGYVMAGDNDAAIAQVDYLLAHPSAMSVGLLRVDPIWDPLRSNPRFRALLAKYAK